MRLTNPSRTVTVASPDWGFAHQGEEIEAAIDGILTANDRACSSAPRSTACGSHITEEMVATLQMSMRMVRQPNCARHC